MGGTRCLYVLRSVVMFLGRYMRRNRSRDGGAREISASYTVAGIRTGKIRKIPDVGFCLWIRYTIVIPFMLYISFYVANPIRQIYRVPTHE